MLESIHNEQSKGYYKRCLDRFQEYTGKELDDLIEISSKEFTKIVMSYIISLKSQVSPNSIPTMLAPVKRFCVMNDVLLNWKKIEYLFPDQVKVTGQSAWQTSDVQKMLNVTTKLSSIAMIHLLASSGCRVGGLVGLRIKDITNVKHGFKMVKVYAGEMEEYTTFLTPEASYAYDEYIKHRMDSGEEITPTCYVFRHRTSEYKQVDRTAVNMRLKRIIGKANLRGQKVKGSSDHRGIRYTTQLLHGFRKRFNTILKENNDVNDNAIEKMMGHKNGLDGTYLQITDEKLLEHFMKGVVDLTVSNEHRLKLETIELQKAKDELSIEHEQRFDKIEKMMEDMMKSNIISVKNLEWRLKDV